MNPTLIFLFLLVPIVGGLLAATPWLVPANECFAVTVPASAHDDPRLASFRRAYLHVMLVTTLACMVAWTLAPQGTVGGADRQGDDLVLILLVAVTTLLPVVVSFALMLYFRSRVQAVKRESGWEADTRKSSAILSDGQSPRPISLAWNALYLPVIAGLAVFAATMYDRFPARIPMHADFDGTITQWSDKSVGVVLFPAIVAGFLAIAFTVSHWSIIRSKKPVDPDAPNTTSLAYGTFSRMMSIVLLAGGLSLSVAIGIGFFAAALGAATLEQAGLAVTMVAFAFLGVTLVMAAVYGQSGSRVVGHVQAADRSDGMPTDNDRYWKLGVFFVNSDDPAVFVPKRFGIGWTVNLGRPMSWLLLFAVFAVATGFGALVTAIAA